MTGTRALQKKARPMTIEEFDEAAIDYSDLEAKYAIPQDDSYENILIIDHLPRVDATKEDKLIAVLKKNVFANHGSPIADSLYMPRGEDGISKGYLFVEFESREEAEAVAKAAHGFRLDKQHVLYAFRFGDFERLKGIEETFKEPKREDFRERPHLKSWLMDPMARSQFMTAHAAGTIGVYWSQKKGAPEVAFTKNSMTESHAQWSPHGSFLATLHTQGIAIWGGAEFGIIARFPHMNARLLEFSPNETFLVTWSPLEATAPNEPNMLVWNVMANKLVRGFVVAEAASAWPFLRWSYDDGYAARVHDGSTLSIYEAPALTLLDKKSQRIEAIQDYSWSTSAHILAYWTPESANCPARVTLMSVPSRTVLRTKNLFNVNRCVLYWQGGGDYLAVQVDRHAKNKKAVFSNLELFRMHEKDIPVDVVEYKELLTMIAWEPNGDRLLVAASQEFKTIVDLYTMRLPNGQLQLQKLATLERKQLSKMSWSPRGDFVLLAGFESTSSFLEFWNMNEATPSLLAAREHFMATDVEWDPSGRYVASYISYWKHQSDNCIVFWDFKGDQIIKISQQKITAFGWRPCPVSLLSKEGKRNVKKAIKEYAAIFEEQDAIAQNMAETSTDRSRKETLTSWLEWRKSCREQFASRASLRSATYKTAAPTKTNERVDIQEWIEELIETVVEELPPASNDDSNYDSADDRD